MSRAASIDSVDSLRDLRVMLVKFAEAAQSAVAAADGEVMRTKAWLETDQLNHWMLQRRKRHEVLQRAQEELRKKSLYQGVDGTRQSDAEERKAVAVARRAVEEAEAKLDAVKRWHRRLEQEALLYRGQVQQVLRAAEQDVPAAIAGLDRMMASLEKYLALTAPAGTESEPEAAASVARQPVETGEGSGRDEGSEDEAVVREAEADPEDRRSEEEEPRA